MNSPASLARSKQLSTGAAEPPRAARWRPRPLLDWRSLQLTGLIAATGLLDVAAGTGLSYVAGFGEVRSVLSRVDWTWLAAMVGALCVSFIGYHAAYRGIYRAEGGYQLPRGRLLAVVMAGFSGFFAHRGRTPDDLALQKSGAEPRESFVRAATLGSMEQGVLAVFGCTASIVVLLRGPALPADVTWPWAIIPVPAAVIALWAAGRYAPRMRDRPGWRGQISIFGDSARLAGALFRRPLRHRTALAGMITFWAAEMFAVWTGLAAFGLTMDGAALACGFCTGMVFTRRVTPLAGAGTMTLILPVTIWTCGAPLAVAVAGTFAYRALTLWLPMPFALVSLPALRQLSKQSLPGDDQG
jgi:uncharacterized membrane protein YbhN (UPF0104 family)